MHTTSSKSTSVKYVRKIFRDSPIYDVIKKAPIIEQLKFNIIILNRADNIKYHKCKQTAVLSVTKDSPIVFFVFVLFIFILHSRESELYRYILDGKSALAWELPFPRCLGHLSST